MAGNLDFSLFTFHFSFFIFHFSLFIFHFSLFTFHFSLFTFHFSLFTFPKLIQLLEAVPVDDFSQLAVVVVMNGGSCATQFQ